MLFIVLYHIKIQSLNRYTYSIEAAPPYFYSSPDRPN